MQAFAHLRTGTVDELQRKAAAVAAHNPRHANRILGKRATKPATITAPVILATAPTPSGRPPSTPRNPRSNSGRIGIYPWRKLALGEWFDVPLEATTRRDMGRQARQAGKRIKARFGVALTVNDAGRGVIRVTRVA